MVAVETSKLMDTGHWSQNVPRYILGKVAKFGGHSFNGLKVTYPQSWRGLPKPPPPPPPGLDRVKLEVEVSKPGDFSKNREIDPIM